MFCTVLRLDYVWILSWGGGFTVLKPGAPRGNRQQGGLSLKINQRKLQKTGENQEDCNVSPLRDSLLLAQEIKKGKNKKLNMIKQNR